jgi:exportin-5
MHPAIVMNIMQQIPNLNINDLQKLDEKILHSNPLTNATNQGATPAVAAPPPARSTKIDKTRKDLFKKITSHLVGQNVLAKLFRNPPVISDLHPLNNNSKSKNTNLLESHEPSTGIQMQQLFETPR